MRLNGFVILMLALCLSACVIAPPTGAPRISRLPAGEVVRLAPEPPKLSLDDLLLMRQAGATSDAIIVRFRSSGARFDLSPTQIIDWHGRGMPLAVLDVIAEDRERALRNELAQQLADLDQQCVVAVQRERQRAMVCPDPYWPGRFGVWGGYPRRGGAFWGW